MKWIPHEATAVLAAVALHFPLPGVAAACAGAILPDVLDQSMARLASTKRGRQRIFNAVHRGTTHWLGWWLLGCALALLPAVLPTLPAALRPVLLGLCFGGLSHVLLDMLTPAGVPLTPFSRKHKLSLKLCATGSLGEYLFLTGVLAVGWLFWGKDLLRLLG